MASPQQQIFFPETLDDAVTESAFRAAVDRAVDQNAILVIRDEVGDNLILTEPIHHKKNAATLHIRCTSKDGVPTCSIRSKAHSVFHIGGRKAKLVLDNVGIIHECERDDPKDIGACIFGLYRSDVILNDCILVSMHGFCVWGVQSSVLSLTSCGLIAAARSSCVLFGKATLRMKGGAVNGKIHGICSRGDTTLDVENTSFVGCGQRAVYAYHGCALRMQGCRIRGCSSADHAAVDIKACAKGGGHMMTPPVAAAAAAVGAAAGTDDDDNNSFANSSLTSVSEKAVVGDNGKKTRIVRLAHLGHLTKESLCETEASWAPVSGQLTVHLKKCHFEDNKGVGLRIRQEADAIISGIVMNCTFSGNGRGDIVQEKASLQPGIGDGWAYEHDDSSVSDGVTWRPYTAADQARLDAAHRAYVADPTNEALSVVMLGDEYRVDLAAMEQLNVKTHYTRRVAFHAPT